MFISFHLHIKVLNEDKDSIFNGAHPAQEPSFRKGTYLEIRRLISVGPGAHGVAPYGHNAGVVTWDQDMSTLLKRIS